MNPEEWNKAIHRREKNNLPSMNQNATRNVVIFNSFHTIKINRFLWIFCHSSYFHLSWAEAASVVWVSSLMCRAGSFFVWLTLRKSSHAVKVKMPCKTICVHINVEMNWWTFQRTLFILTDTRTDGCELHRTHRLAKRAGNETRTRTRKAAR